MNSATAYEITLTEISKSQNSKDEKIYKVFEVLDEIVPNLGVYSSIMRIVRKQLFGESFVSRSYSSKICLITRCFTIIDSVFTDEFTASSSSGSQEAIQRISYFSKYKILMSKKDEKYEALSEEYNKKKEE